MPARRFYWLMRGGGGVALLLVYLLLLRLWWGHVARDRFNAVVAAARTRGEPVSVADVERRATVRGEDNAALLVKHAAAGLTMNPAQRAFDDRYDPAVALTPSNLALLHGIVVANAGPITDLERAAKLRQYDWGTRLSSPMMVSIALPTLNAQRDLANMLHYAAIDAHARRDDAEALRAISAILALSEAVEHDVPILLTHLVATGQCMLACNAVREVAPTLRASSQQVRDLIAQLLDDRGLRDGGVRAWYGERLMAMEITAHPQTALPGFGKPIVAWPMLPVAWLDGVELFDRESDAAAAMRLPTFAAVAAALPTATHPSSTEESWAHWFAHPFANFNQFATTRTATTEFHGITQRRVAAVLLAIRQYEMEHDGQDPRTLAELVPADLPALPADPFAPDGHVLRFVAGPTGVVAIYSVNEDGIDDGGSTQPLSRASFFAAGGTEWAGRDAVFRVHPPPPHPAATQSSD